MRHPVFFCQIRPWTHQKTRWNRKTITHVPEYCGIFIISLSPYTQQKNTMTCLVLQHCNIYQQWIEMLLPFLSLVASVISFSTFPFSNKQLIHIIFTKGNSNRPTNPWYFSGFTLKTMCLFIYVPCERQEDDTHKNIIIIQEGKIGK